MPSFAFSDLALKSISAPCTTDFWDKKVPGFGIRVGPRSKTFIVKVDNSRKKIGEYPALSLQEARRRALIAKTTKASNGAEKAFPEAYTAFKDMHCSQKKGRTAKDYLRILDRHYEPRFKNKRLADITLADVEAFTDKMLDTPSERSHALAVGRTFFKFCVRRRYIASSPLEGVQLPKSPARDRVLTDKELQCIWKACEQREGDSSTKAGAVPEHPATTSPSLLINPTFAAIVKLLILTGCRKSEIANLQASWIKKDRITIPKEFTKNSREHCLPFGALCAGLITPRATSGTTHLFPARGTSSAFNGFSKCKLALDKTLGKDFEPWTLHDLRRTFVSNMARLGVRIEVCEKLVNHVSGTFRGVVGVYNRYDFWDEMVEAVEKHDAYIQRLVGAQPEQA